MKISSDFRIMDINRQAAHMKPDDGLCEPCIVQPSDGQCVGKTCDEKVGPFIDICHICLFIAL